MTNQEILTQRVKDEIGEETNPAYIEKLLEKNVANLLSWMKGNLQDTQSTIQKTIYHAVGYQESENENEKKVLHLGVKILENRFKTILFIVKEIKSRIEATEVASDKRL